MEKLVLRREFDPYRCAWGFLAVFPDDPANGGRLAATAFYFDNYGKAMFEPYGEIDREYYYCKTKRVRKNSFEAVKCKTVLEAYYNTEFKLMEKIM